MLIRLILTWVQRTRQKELGYVADYCRICHQVTANRVLEQRKTSRILFISLGPDELLIPTQDCQGCQTESRFFPGRFTGLSPNASGPMESLISATFPQVREVYKEQLEVDEKAAAPGAGADPATRQKLLLEAFGMAEPGFRRGGGSEGLRILGLAMRPLRPTEGEIRACVARYHNTRSRMGGMLHVEAVMVAIYPESEVKRPGEYSY